MPRIDFKYEADCVWNKIELIDEFNLFIKDIRDSRYAHGERTIDDLFFEFYPIWKQSGKALTSTQSEALDNRSKSKFVNDAIAPIQSKNDHSKKTGKRNIQLFLIWLHAYHEDKARDWFKIVHKRYRLDNDEDKIAKFSFRPFDGEPPSFEETELAKEWGLVPRDESFISNAVSTVQLAFGKREKIQIGVMAFLAITAAAFAYLYSENSRKLSQYELAAEAPNFNILYLDVDHLGRDQFDRIRNGEESAPDGNELYAQMFGLPIVDFGLHESLRDELFENYRQVRSDFEEREGICLINDSPSTEVTRTNTLFLVIQSIGGSVAYDVTLNMRKISLEGRSLIDGNSSLYPAFNDANNRRGFIMPRRITNLGDDRETSNDTDTETMSISLGDLLSADGRLIELEAYTDMGAKHYFYGSQFPCDSEESAPAYATGREIKVSVPTEYVPISITYRTVLGDEITQEIRKPNQMPVLLSRGMIIHG